MSRVHIGILGRFGWEINYQNTKENIDQLILQITAFLKHNQLTWDQVTLHYPKSHLADMASLVRGRATVAGHTIGIYGHKAGYSPRRPKFATDGYMRFLNHKARREHFLKIATKCDIVWVMSSQSYYQSGDRVGAFDQHVHDEAINACQIAGTKYRVLELITQQESPSRTDVRLATS